MKFSAELLNTPQLLADARRAGGVAEVVVPVRVEGDGRHSATFSHFVRTNVRPKLSGKRVLRLDASAWSWVEGE